ncbi:hypothetical protein R1flu_021736 [Riccia fluitans]|uniref:Uncharacterized protein n=1 Tax=Riccia fluitans TaxID=41844 RepID=A0ABD1ZQ77_9MARC
MSFWPKLRKRSLRGRKKSTTNSSRPNPYSSIGLDKLALARAELDAQRAQFAAEKGVPISAVRFVSGSARGWILLPRSAISPTPDYDPSSSPSSFNLSTASSSPERSGSAQRTANSTTSIPSQPQKLTPPTDSVCNGPLDPSIPGSNNSSSSSPSSKDGEFRCSSSTDGAPVLQRISETPVGSSFRTISAEIIDPSTLTKKEHGALSVKASNTATVVLVSLSVLSTTIGSNGLVAVIQSFWNGLKLSSVRALTVLATCLISAVWQHSSTFRLKQSTRNIVSTLPVQTTTAEDLPRAEMKVTAAAAPFSPISPLKGTKDVAAAADSPRSSFAFPILSRDSSVSVSTPNFQIIQQQENQLLQGGKVRTLAEDGIPKLKPIITPVRVVAVSSSQPSSPAALQKPSQKLKARIFKCHTPKKSTASENPNSSADEGATMDAEDASTAWAESPRVADSPTRYKRLSFKTRRSKSSLKEAETDDNPPSGQSSPERELENVQVNNGSKSPEVLASRNPNNVSADGGGKKMSRSCELRFSFKNLKKKKDNRSEELYPTAAADCQPLALETVAVKGLEELAFPFNNQFQNGSESPVNKSEKKKSSSAKLLSCDFDKSREGNVATPLTPRSGTSTTTSRFSKSNTTPVPRVVEKNMVLDYRPELRKVKTRVAQQLPPPPAGEPSPVLNRDILGTFLVLAVLAFLLLGKIPAILGTASLCLVLSHVQKFLWVNMTPLQRERLASSRADFSRLKGHQSYSQGSARGPLVTMFSR